MSRTSEHLTSNSTLTKVQPGRIASSTKDFVEPTVIKDGGRPDGIASLFAIVGGASGAAFLGGTLAGPIGAITGTIIGIVLGLLLRRTQIC